MTNNGMKKRLRTLRKLVVPALFYSALAILNVYCIVLYTSRPHVVVRSGKERAYMYSQLHVYDHAYSTTLNLPSKFEEHIADVGSPFLPSDVAVFWHIIRSGGETIKTIGAECLDMVMATHTGVRGHEREKELAVVSGERPGKYLNVDTSSLEGLERAGELGIAEAGALIVSPYVLEVGEVLNSRHRGRIFCLLRHPVHRISSYYEYLKGKDKSISRLSLEEFALNPKKGQNNLMVRILTGSLHRGINDEDLHVAVSLLRRKVLVGLFDRKRESFDRFENYFGWTFNTSEARMCYMKTVFLVWPAQSNREKVRKDSPTWKAVATANAFDIKLYEYAVQLFGMQGQYFSLEE